MASSAYDWFRSHAPEQLTTYGHTCECCVTYCYLLTYLHVVM